MIERPWSSSCLARVKTASAPSPVNCEMRDARRRGGMRASLALRIEVWCLWFGGIGLCSLTGTSDGNSMEEPGQQTAGNHGKTYNVQLIRAFEPNGEFMTSLKRLFSIVGVWWLIAGFGIRVANADTSHARIVRLSMVQGDVRFARDVKGDPLNDSRSGWEGAVLNLPIRQGYVLATDAGRAEVEFENGAMAFLAENTVLEFFDLSSEDGGFTTRLILRQGSAEFYVQPGRGDYFSVTGGDFSVQADTRTTFRMNNFDDGSNVSVLHGRLTALANGKNTPVAKGQSLSLKAGDPGSMQIDHASDSDEFDQWGSGRIESVNTATSAAMQYSNTSDYTSGYADLYTYGGWFPVAGYGSCWRPYGVGLGWSPFDSGSWFYDSSFGWSFIGGQPWGWLPYHYGGWLFRPGLGWVWSPSSNFGGGGLGRWRPVTG